jgi:hypothetical protein
MEHYNIAILYMSHTQIIMIEDNLKQKQSNLEVMDLLNIKLFKIQTKLSKSLMAMI